MLLLALSFGVLYWLAEGFDPYNPNDNPSVYPTDSLIAPGAAFPFANEFPSDRALHSLIVTPSYLIAYGGVAANGSYLGDVNLYHLASQRWSGPITRRECCNELGQEVDLIGLSNRDKDGRNITFMIEGAEGDYPLPRAEHAACAVDDNSMLIFGGQSSLSSRPGQLLGDMWSFDLLQLKWAAIETVSTKVGSTPGRRAGHSFISFLSKSSGLNANNTEIQSVQRMILFGGRVAYNGSTSAVVGTNDLWEWKHNTRVWNRLDRPPQSGFNGLAAVYPAPRQHSAVAGFRLKIFVFGGDDPASGRLYGDLWMFNLQSRIWTQLSSGDGQSGQGYSYSPPPLEMSYMIAMEGNQDDAHDCDEYESYPDADSSQDCGSLLIYGGLGTGGLCLDPLSTSITPFTPSSTCLNQLLAIGQVYQYTLIATTWPSPLLDSVNPNDEQDASTAHWVSARLGDDQSSIQGRRRLKDYVYEALAYDCKHSILYELGGINSQQPLQQQAMGGSTPVRYSDTLTGEEIRDAVYLPVNNAWTLQQALYNGSLLQRQSMNNNSESTFNFESKLRVYSVAARDITLMQEVGAKEV